MMLSEPPSRYTAGPAVQSMSLENYKGILLCDRPAAAAKGQVSGDGHMPFLPAGRGDERHVGLQPSIEQRSRFELSRSLRQSHKIQKPSVLTRHKKWLYSFASAVKQMQLDKVENQLNDAESQKLLRDAQAEERRERALAISHTEKTGEPAKATAASPAAADEQVATVAAAKPGAKPAAAKKIVKTKKDTKPKPKWAMTEEEALDAELNDTQRLIDFAQHLDYDQFINDYEVKEALAIMRDRVKEIATEKGLDLAEVAADEADDEESVADSNVTESMTAKEKRRVEKAKNPKIHAMAPGFVADAEWDSNVSVTQKLRNALSGDALELADRILAASTSMRQIHTKQTLARLLQDVTLRSADRHANASKVPPMPAVQPPVVSTLAAESQAGGNIIQQQKRVLLELRKSKDHVQNMPYMYRCPSI